jgi:predicted TIM-barrel fold metal-dependent hydrolase
MQSFIDALPLIDHHCHGVVSRDLDRVGLEALMTEGHRRTPGVSQFDKPLGLMVQRWCAPVLGLEPHAAPEAYVERRTALGIAEVTRRLVGGSGTAMLILDTGLRAAEILGVEGMAAATGVATREVVRIEAVMEEVARSGVSSGAALLHGFDDLLAARAQTAVGLKSIVAYRTSFDIDQTAPSNAEAALAGDAWLSALARGTARRLEDATLIRYALWRAGEICRERGFPLQLHVGFGDSDVRMPKCDPTVFTPFIASMEAWNVPITLLHCYPFIREAGWLAEVFSNVYMDIGVIQNFTGPAAPRIVAEAMEITPFFKHLYSSDAFGLPELYFLGAKLFRNALARVLDGWIADGDATVAQAEAIASAVSHENARRIYRL